MWDSRLIRLLLWAIFAPVCLLNDPSLKAQQLQMKSGEKCISGELCALGFILSYSRNQILHPT